MTNQTPTAPIAYSPTGAETTDGLSLLPVSLSIFVDTYVSAPPRIIAPRDFAFKAVIGEPDW